MDAPIDVTLGPDGAGGMRPVTFLYRRERHQVAEILDRWVMMAQPWWEDPQAVGKAPAEVTYWRLRTTKGGVFEISQAEQKWRMYKIYD